MKMPDFKMKESIAAAVLSLSASCATIPTKQPEPVESIQEMELRRALEHEIKIVYDLCDRVLGFASAEVKDRHLRADMKDLEVADGIGIQGNLTLGRGSKQSKEECAVLYAEDSSGPNFALRSTINANRQDKTKHVIVSSRNEVPKIEFKDLSDGEQYVLQKGDEKTKSFYNRLVTNLEKLLEYRKIWMDRKKNKKN